MDDSNRILIGAVLFILFVVVSNVVLYGIVRGVTRGGDSRWLSSLKDTLSKPLDSQANKSMDELRQHVEELEKKKSRE